jgi:transcriptional regulator GlxA family with amidase domain
MNTLTATRPSTLSPLRPYMEVSSHMRTVALVAYPGVQSQDVCAPLDVFAEANRLLVPDSRYRVEVVGLEHGPLRCSNGMTIFADRHFSHTDDAYDLVLVAGGPGLVCREFTGEFYAWLKRASRQARRFGAFCSDAFILARAGLLDQRMITTHGSHADELAALCPTARVEVDRPFVEDGNLYTSAGTTGAIEPFGSADRMRCVFQRCMGVSPRQYRFQDRSVRSIASPPAVSFDSYKGMV